MIYTREILLADYRLRNPVVAQAVQFTDEASGGFIVAWTEGAAHLVGHNSGHAARCAPEDTDPFLVIERAGVPTRVDLGSYVGYTSALTGTVLTFWAKERFEEDYCRTDLDVVHGQTQNRASGGWVNVTPAEAEVLDNDDNEHVGEGDWNDEDEDLPPELTEVAAEPRAYVREEQKSSQIFSDEQAQAAEDDFEKALREHPMPTSTQTSSLVEPPTPDSSEQERLKRRNKFMGIHGSSKKHRRDRD